MVVAEKERRHYFLVNKIEISSSTCQDLPGILSPNTRKNNENEITFHLIFVPFFVP
jgi:hypothetical protein